MVSNARCLARTLLARGYNLISGGTDTHLVLVDLRSKSVTGRDAERTLERAGLICNKNSIPFDPLPPAQTSGIRLGTPAGTTRGFGSEEFQQIGSLIARILDEVSIRGGGDLQDRFLLRFQREVENLCDRFPMYVSRP